MWCKIDNGTVKVNGTVICGEYIIVVFFPREDKVFTMGQNGQVIKLTKVFCRRMFDFIGVC